MRSIVRQEVRRINDDEVSGVRECVAGETVEDVSVDVCEGGCGGVWLDYGELGKIRHLPGSPAEREKAAQRYSQEVLGLGFAGPAGFGAPAATRRVARVFRFLSPRHRFWG